MPQSLHQSNVHIIFSTKNRMGFISEKIENELYAYLGAIIKGLDGAPIMINGDKDHIHIFSSLPKLISLVGFIEEIKRTSSRWIKTKGDEYRNFAWQRGYAAFSVGRSQKNSLVNYIANQKAHHRFKSVQEELREILKSNEVDFDERYLWD